MSNPPSGTPSTEKARIFLSYGRADAEELAERLEADLSLLGFDVWRETGGRSGRGRSGTTRLRPASAPASSWWRCLLAMPSPEESVCRDELAFARFACKLPIVPALAEPCEPPL